MLEVRLLGELSLLRSGRSLPLPASKKTRALLGYLAASRQACLRERLCELLWEGPDDPRAALRWSLAKLRPLVDDRSVERLCADRERVVFEARGASVDLHAVRLLVGEDPGAASLAQLNEAQAQLRGELLDGLDLPDCYRYQAWLSGEREAVRRLRVRVLSELVARHRGTPEVALRHAHGWLAVEPLAEAAHAEVARALHGLGRTREALDGLRLARALIVAELGRESGELERARAELSAGATPPSAPAPSAPPAAPATFAGDDTRRALVGRVRERAELGAVLRAAGTAAGRTLLVVGEPGIGKSSLLEELARETRALGGRVLFGRAFEAEMVRPYGAWIDAMRPLAASEIPEALRGDVAPLVPALPANAVVDPIRLFESMAALLRGLAASARPLTLILDDVQWLDESGAALLSLVVRSLEQAPLLIACAARPGDLADNRPARDALRGLDRDGRLTRLELAPLGASEIAQLVGGAVDAERAFADSGGNPLYAIEIARAAGLGRAGEVSLEGLLDDRLASLEGRARDVLPFAAALGRTFSAELLAAAAGLAPADLLGAVEELERRGVLRGASGGGYDFAHDLVRRAAYRALSEPRRRLVHREIAQTMARLPDEDHLLAGDLAHHAALGGLALLAAQACVRAGRRCLQLYAQAEAEKLATRGLALLDGLGAAERVEVEIPLYYVRVFAHQCRTLTRALDGPLSRAVLMAESHNRLDLVQEGFHLLAMLNWRSEDLERAVDTTRRSAEAARDTDPATAARALATTSRCLALLERDMDQSRSLALEADALARAHRLTIPEVPWALGVAFHFSGEVERSRGAQQQAIELNESAQDRWGECMCRLDLAMLELEHGQPARALVEAEAAALVAHKLGEGSELPFAEALAQLAHAAAGRPDDAAIARCVQALRDVDAKASLSYVLNQLAGLYVAAGRSDDARRAADEALAVATALSRRSEVVVAHATLARLHSLAGRRSLARAHREALLAAAAEPSPMSARARAILDDVVPAKS